MHILVLDQRSLTANLGTDGVMWETGSREERNLLATGDGVHDIDGGNSRLDHLLRVVTLERINWLALYIKSNRENIIIRYLLEYLWWVMGVCDLARDGGVRSRASKTHQRLLT